MNLTDEQKKKIQENAQMIKELDCEILYEVLDRIRKDYLKKIGWWKRWLYDELDRETWYAMVLEISNGNMDFAKFLGKEGEANYLIKRLL